MLLSPRIGLKPLAVLSRRLSIGLGAGVDSRRVFAREAEGSAGLYRKPFVQISEAINQGSSLKDALTKTGNYFPQLFREMVAVGEQTGQLPEVFRQLAEHYDHQLTLRRAFVAAITWPIIQLLMAICVIGLLIWIMGMIGDPKHPTDLLGFGLIGTPGLIKYLLYIAGAMAILAVLYISIRRGVLWAQPIQRIILRLPKIGRCLQTLALSRLAWALHLTLESGMDLKPALRLAIDSTHNVRFTSQNENIWQAIRGGKEIHEALAATGEFPRDFLDAVEVGEDSGRLVESMRTLSKQYQEEARAAMAMLTVIGGFLVWCMVAGLIIMLIFRLAGFYIGTINDAVNQAS